VETRKIFMCCMYWLFEVSLYGHNPNQTQMAQIVSATPKNKLIKGGTFHESAAT